MLLAARLSFHPLVDDDAMPHEAHMAQEMGPISRVLRLCHAYHLLHETAFVAAALTVRR